MLGRLIAGAKAAVIVLAASASAVSAQSYDGSGLVKFGVFGQGTFLEADQSLPVIASASPSGFAGGVSAGYDLRLYRHFLLGVEIDGSFGDARGKAGITDYGFDYLMTARGRIGVQFERDWLLYGTVGVGFLGIEAQNPGVGNKATDTLTGVVAGAGLEIPLSHVLLFSEYLYGDFGSREFSIAGARHDVDIQSHVVRAGIKFKVGHDYAHSYDHPEHYKRHDSLK